MIRVRTIKCAIAFGILFIPLISFAQDAPDLAADEFATANALTDVRDISSRYSYVTRRGVPVIENPDLCEADGLDLRLTVRNIVDLKGFIVADLHNDNADDFLDSEKVVLRVRAEASSETIVFCLPLASPGRYAVAVYHDENSNRAFDKGFLRIPRERFGMSNNPVFGLSAPEFEEAAFDVPLGGRDLTINLISSGDILKGRRR